MVLFQLLNWVSQEAAKDDRVKITGINRPLSRDDLDHGHNNAGSTILVKPHRDAVQKLSIEYARLVRENQRLKSVIASAVNILDDSINNVEARTGSQLREECGDCVGAVGQAIWDCGTLDIDCIK